MDGLEWTREKYNKVTQHFLTHAEKWGVRYSDHLIADSKGIQDYLQNKYNAHAVLIPYGADTYTGRSDDAAVLTAYNVSGDTYDLVIARFEPENNIEHILKAYAAFATQKLVLIGDHTNTLFGRRMYKEYGANPLIQFAGAHYNTQKLNALRYHSRLYIHGHSVGGTNPSLLEAMACNTLICAHDNQFNKHVLEEDAFYFSDSKDILELISSASINKDHKNWRGNNRQKIEDCYNWETITNNIESYFKRWKSGEQILPVLCTV